MSHRIFAAAFVLGLAATLWIGFGFIGSHGLALAMTLAILATYLAGSQELRLYRRATQALSAALDAAAEAPADFSAWLAALPASLREPVRLRVETGRGALPGPALAPYLAGLLVMLGMLGTFLGLVLTFRGTVFALEGAADLQAMRAALAEPIKGLGLSFGTSVAGVATSAMLGLMAALARRERLDVARRLDAATAGPLRGFTQAHQRQGALSGLQAHAGALPALAERLAVLADDLERRHTELGAQLLAAQERFQQQTGAAYAGLADRVAQALEHSLVAGAHAAGESMRPVVESAMARIEQQAATWQARSEQLAQAQVDGVAQRLATTADTVAAAWQQALRTHEQVSGEQAARLAETLQGFSERFRQDSTQLVAGVGAEAAGLLQATRQDITRVVDEAQALLSRSLEGSQAQLTQALSASGEQLAGSLAATQAQLVEALSGTQAQLQQSLVATQAQLLEAVQASQAQLAQAGAAAESRLAQLVDTTQGRMTELVNGSAAQLSQLREEESARGAAALARLGTLEAAFATHLSALGQSLEAPLSRLLQVSAEVPQAGAELLARLRQEMSALAERDQVTLQERTLLLERLGRLVDSLERSTSEQQSAVVSLASAASQLMDGASARFAQALETQSRQGAESGARLEAGAIELSSLAQAFAEAMTSFQSGNEKLMGTLQQVEAAIERSAARSDEQLAYYVAQAREVIDLSIASQQGLLESLREASKARPAAEAQGVPA